MRNSFSGRMAPLPAFRERLAGFFLTGTVAIIESCSTIVYGRANLAAGTKQNYGLIKGRKAKINKHKRRKKLRAHRHKKRTWQK